MDGVEDDVLLTVQLLCDSCSTELEERSHRTVDFFTDHADDLRPVGLAFFQSEWDETVRHVFHHVFSKSPPRSPSIL